MHEHLSLCLPSESREGKHFVGKERKISDAKPSKSQSLLLSSPFQTATAVFVCVCACGDTKHQPPHTTSPPLSQPPPHHLRRRHPRRTVSIPKVSPALHPLPVLVFSRPDRCSAPCAVDCLLPCRRLRLLRARAIAAGQTDLTVLRVRSRGVRSLARRSPRSVAEIWIAARVPVVAAGLGYRFSGDDRARPGDAATYIYVRVNPECRSVLAAEICVEEIGIGFGDESLWWGTSVAKSHGIVRGV